MDVARVQYEYSTSTVRVQYEYSMDAVRVQYEYSMRPPCVGCTDAELSAHHSASLPVRAGTGAAW
jgi:hypothetical protein